jgi:two-component system, cell cycle sensor histidine kinase and response regulator CckA
VRDPQTPDETIAHLRETLESLEQHCARIEDELRQSQKTEAIGRLAGGIAHDLNNALTAIAGYAELALGEVDAAHPARADIEEIRQATERAGAVTRQLLAFSRKQLLEPRLFDLNETVRSLSRMLARLLGADIAVTMHAGDRLPPILGDPRQVEQVVINLAVNARDAMPGGGSLDLSTSVVHVAEGSTKADVPLTPGPYVMLRVTDTGLGMPRDVQSRIFEPFFTTKDVGKGTGLGLSMVHGTLKQMNGFIFVDSEEGRGTTFRLYFPPARAVEAELAPPGSAVGAEFAPHALLPSGRASSAPTVVVADVPIVRAEPAPRGTRRSTLLIVEDEPAVRNLVASALRPDGYHLLLATSADEAVRLADAHDGPLHLLLTDAVMPGKSGIELAHDLIARRPGLPVIVMSGYTEETLNIGGPDDPIALLRKPFSPRELRQRIRDRLDRSQRVATDDQRRDR